MAPAEDIARFRGKYKVGWDQLRLECHARQKKMGLLRSEWTLSERPDDSPAWESLSNEKKDRFDNLMALYAAIVSRIDKSVGDLLAGLKQRGVLDNTLILMMSDNGYPYPSHGTNHQDETLWRAARQSAPNRHWKQATRIHLQERVATRRSLPAAHFPHPNGEWKAGTNARWGRWLNRLE